MPAAVLGTVCHLRRRICEAAQPGRSLNPGGTGPIGAEVTGTSARDGTGVGFSSRWVLVVGDAGNDLDDVIAALRAAGCVVDPPCRSEDAADGSVTVDFAVDDPVPLERAEHPAGRHGQPDPLGDRRRASRAEFGLQLGAAGRAASQQARVASAEARYRHLVDHLPDCAVFVYDRQLRLVMCGGESLARLGYDTATLTGRTLDAVLGETDAEVLRPWFERGLAGEAHRFEFPAKDRIHLVDVAPFEDGIVVVANDITELRRSEQARRRLEDRYRAAFEDAPVAMAQIGADGRYLKVNRAFCELVDYSEAEIVGVRAAALAHPDDAAFVAERVAGGLGGAVTTSRGERRIVRRDGTPVWVAVSGTVVRGADGAVDHLLVHHLDISDRKEMEEQLRRLADHDPLTDLLNRRGFELALDRTIAYAARYPTSGALLMLDLDGFKKVNDSLGHDAGDRVIAAIGGVLRGRLRGSDVIARLGGDEFAIILPHASLDEAEAVADSVVAAVRDHVTLLPDGHPVTMTTSVGVAMFVKGLSGTEVLTCADVALYAAKDAGRNGHATYRAATIS